MNLSAPAALYINWPVLPPSFKDRYHRALQREITDHIGSLPTKTVRSIFMDGAPATYPQDPLLDTLGILRVITLATAEISLVVTEPPSVEEVTVWQRVGINRINYAIRDTMKQAWLSYVPKAVPFEHISVDMQLQDRWSKDEVQQLLDVGVQHISVYSDEDDVHEEVSATWYEKVAQQLMAAGFDCYSAHDFALPGHRSVQQEIYFAREPYQGFGVGACSFDGAARVQTTDSVATYCTAIESGARAVTREVLTHGEHKQERIMQGLMSTGIAVDELMHGRSTAAQQHGMQLIQEMVDADLLMNSGSWLVLTVRGRFVENEIITKLMHLHASDTQSH